MCASDNRDEEEKKVKWDDRKRKESYKAQPQSWQEAKRLIRCRAFRHNRALIVKHTENIGAHKHTNIQTRKHTTLHLRDERPKQQQCNQKGRADRQPTNVVIQGQIIVQHEVAAVPPAIELLFVRLAKQLGGKKKERGKSGKCGDTNQK